MKWLGAFAVLCLGVGSALWFPGRQERACYLNLTRFDHHINCPGMVHRMYDDIISDGVWTHKGPVLDLCSPEDLRCPVTGTEYVLTFTVGDHPYCPVHGRLIERYGYRPHDPPGTPPGIITARRSAGGLVLCLGVLLLVITGLVALLRLPRTPGGMAQPSDGSGRGDAWWKAIAARRNRDG